MTRRKLRIVAALAVLLFAFGMIPRPADASFEVKLNYWPTTVTVSNAGGQFGNWSTNFWGGDFRWTSNQHWGIHLKYDTGNPSSWGGSFAGSTGGTDTVWSGDIFYAWQFPVATVRAFAGWGDLKHTSVFGGVTQTLEANGYRVGADAQFPVPNTGWAFNASAAWYPSTSTSFTFFGTTTSSGNATDFSASVQYMWPQGWLVEGGYRWITENTGALPATICPCTINTNGVFVDLGYHW